MITEFILTYRCTPRGGIGAYSSEKRFPSHKECVDYIANENAKIDAYAAKHGINIDEPVYTTESIEEVELRFANMLGYTDVHPNEIVRYVSDKTLEIREMNTELLNPEDLEFHLGGFSAHCSNQRCQEYKYTSNEDAPIRRIRKNNKGQWVYKGTRYSVSDTPHKFYDYNF